MHARFVLIAAATLMSSSAFAAEPLQPTPQPPTQPDSSTPKVVLASAKVEQPTTPSTQASATPKRRLGRVTDCRCGDQQPQAGDDE